MKLFLSITLLTFLTFPLLSQTHFEQGKGNFEYKNYELLQDKTINIYYYNPSEDPSGLPILFVMHGTNRNADDYRDNWVDLARKHQILVVVPEFSREHFPSARSYNLGGMLDKDGQPVAEEQWAYSLIEPIFDHIKVMAGSREKGYDIFGHSAGAQFVHRYAIFKKNLRANRIISANAGWYTMPDFNQEFPYGLSGTPLTKAQLSIAIKREMTILLGTRDNNPNHRYLRTSSGAMAQGPHRLARGRQFFKQAQTLARDLQEDLNWRIEYVYGVGHNNARMAEAAAALLFPEQDKSTPQPEIDNAYLQEVIRVQNHPKVKRAFKSIEELDPETMEDQIHLTQIPAPPFGEEKRAERFAQMMTGAGADSVWIDNVGNVIAERKGTIGKRTVVIEGHLDTVFPEDIDVTVVKKGDTLYSPGIGDNTRALSVLITLLKSMERNDIRTQDNVLLIGTVGEEGLGDLRGVKNLFSRNGPGNIDSYIAIDGGSFGRIVNQALGSRRYRVTFKGPGGHSWGAFGLVNPHIALGRAMNKWADDAARLSQKPGPKVSYNVGVIGGGTSVNSIPFESWMEIDMRSEDAARLEAMDNLLQMAVQEATDEENMSKLRGPDLEVDLEVIGDRPTGKISSEIALVQRSMAAITSLGGKPRLAVSSTNANTPISLNVPAVTISRGGKGGNAHSLNEWWINEESYVAIQNALLILLSEAGFEG